MSKPLRFVVISIALNILSLLVYTLVVSSAAFHKFTLATGILALMGLGNLILSIIALTRSLQQEGNQHARKAAWVSLAVAIGMMLVIGILLLNIWVYNFRA